MRRKTNSKKVPVKEKRIINRNVVDSGGKAHPVSEPTNPPPNSNKTYLNNNFSAVVESAKEDAGIGVS